jgi:hypothetical protein
MGFLEFLKGRSLRPRWKYEARGIIWRVIPTASGKIVGEERDVSEKKARFFCLNQHTGEVFWEGLTLEEQWWIGIETVHQDLILFHGFSTPDLPGHKMIIAVDVLTGRTVWQNKEMTFVAALGESVFASNDTIQGRIYCVLDCRTGMVLRDVAEDDEEMRGAQHIPVFEAANEILLPTPVSDSDPLTMAIAAHANVDATAGGSEALDWEDLVVLSYCEKTRESTDEQLNLRNIIKVVNKTNGNVLFTEILDSNSSVHMSESFFIQHSVLYFVKGQNELTAVHLPGFHAEE